MAKTPSTLNVITVIPLTRSKVAGELSYFTASDPPTLGAIVSVPLRSRNIHAIVTAVTPATEMKADIKDAAYQMKKLGRIRSTAFFPPSFMKACETLAEYYAATVGAVIDTVVSDALLENAGKIKMSAHQPAMFDSIKPAGSIDETFAVQGDDEDRLGSWRSLIRQEFARKRSVAMYVPTIEDARSWAAALTKGIEGYIFVLHGKMTKKEITNSWNAISEVSHPVVIIATGSFAILPRGDLDTVIIERENGRGWISQKHPYLDLRHAIETISRSSKRTVYRADSLLRAETLQRIDLHEISQGSPFKWRSVSTAHDGLVDMVRNEARPPETVEASGNSTNHANQPSGHDAADLDTPLSDSRFRVLSAELEELIRRNREESTHLFILTIRRGTSPVTVCSDCESIVSCKKCSSPVVLHTSRDTGRNFFMCHHCGERRSANEVCANCGSWRLTPLGIGIDRVRDEIRAIFPDMDIFKIDADSAKTEGQISSALEKFRAKPGSVLLGTEMALVHLDEKIDHVAVASLDSLFALPDFRIQEKIMYTLIRLRGLASRSILVQSRRAGERIFEYGLKGNLSDFYRSTLDERKDFIFPPFSTLIKITIEGKKDAIAAMMAQVQETLNPLEIDVFPAFTATVRNNSIIHGLLKIPRGGWPNSDLVEKIRSLPPSVKVRVDPESLL